MRRSITLLVLSACACILLLCRSCGYPPIEDLLIDESAFPPGWSTSSDGPKPIARAPLGGTKSVESIELDFYAYGGGASERIRRFESAQDAADEFERQSKIVFRDSEFNTPWIVPAECSYHGSGADQFHYACSTFEGQPWPGCAYIAQYGKYFVHFQTSMLPGLMTYADLEIVLRTIDEQMEQHLGDR
jgi:hypothetical protein